MERRHSDEAAEIIDACFLKDVCDFKTQNSGPNTTQRKMRGFDAIDCRDELPLKLATGSNDFGHMPLGNLHTSLTGDASCNGHAFRPGVDAEEIRPLPVDLQIHKRAAIDERRGQFNPIGYQRSFPRRLTKRRRPAQAASQPEARNQQDAEGISCARARYRQFQILRARHDLAHPHRTCSVSAS